MSEIPSAPSQVRVVPLPRVAQGARWRTEAMRSYSQPVLIWFTKGQGRITVAGSTRGFGPHNAVFLPAGTMHGFEMTGQVFGSLVYFPLDLGADLPADPQHLRFREAHDQAELTQLIDNLQREVERDMPGHDRALTYHGGLLAVWLERQIAARADAEVRPDKAHQLTAAFTSLVERDFRSGMTVHDYAAKLGVTPTHLSRVCNTSCGRPASALLADRVHYEARRLLAETRTPVKDIAQGLGFTSAAYFTRAFQKKTGKTPTNFFKTG